MTGPLGRRSRAARARVLWAAGLASLALGAFLIVQDGEIEESGGPGIIPFEVAGSSERAEEILAEWGEEGRSAAELSLGVDYAYLIAYSLLLAVACTAVAGRLGRRGRDSLAKIGPYIGWGALGAGLLDGLENLALLRVLAGHLEGYPQLALAAASGKFALGGLAVAYIVVGLVAAQVRGRPTGPVGSERT